MLQPQDGPQQHGLARTGAADNTEDVLLVDLHVEAVVDDLRAEAIDDAAHLEDDGSGLRHQMSISMKSTAKSASARMMMKMDCTTAIVVSRPSSREEPRTCRPR